jgi:5-methylcytosine-specific restriction protein A
VKTLRPQVRTLNTGMAQPSTTKRLNGKTKIALIRRLSRERPRMCAECYRNGFVRFGDELDHIAPLWKGGSNDPINLQWLCVSCHSDKTARETKERAGLV